MKHIAFLLVLGAVGSANAAYTYMDWSSTTSGSMVVGSETVNATMSGPIAFGDVNGSGYWLPNTPYTGSPDGTTDMLAIAEAATYTMTFDKALINPIFSVISVGQGGLPVTYAFDQSFTILSQGAGYWGAGPLSQSGNNLIGEEGHGTIQFSGAVSSITWTTNNYENWHGFNVAAESAVPEPGTMTALGLGLAAVARRRRNK